MVGERHLAGPGAQATTDQGLQGRRMVRIAEGAAAAQPALAEIAGQGAHHRCFQRLLRLKRRQDAGQARRQHRLARTRRTDHQEVVAAGGGDLEHPLGRLLALDLGEVGIVRAIRLHQGLRWRQDLLAAEMVDQGEQRRRGDDPRRLEAGAAGDGAGLVRGLEAAPRGLAPANRWTDHAAPRRPGGDRRGQDAGHAHQRAVEGQLAQHDMVLDALARDHAQRGEQADRDRQVVVAAFLGEIGGREVDGDAQRRQRQAERPEGGPHPLPAFADRLVGKADQGETEIAGRHQHLDIDRQDVDTLERHGPDPGLHDVPPGVCGEQSMNVDELSKSS